MASSLQQELKQNKPFSSLKQEVIINLNRTVAVLGHQMEQELKPFGLTPTQFNVLRILRGAGEEALCQYEVGQRLVAQVPDVPRLLARMEKSGLIKRRRAPSDKRVVTSAITKQGLAVLAELDSLLVQWERHTLRHLSNDQLLTLNEMLNLAREK